VSIPRGYFAHHICRQTFAFFSVHVGLCVMVMKINIIRGQKTAQQLPCFAYNHIFTREQQKVGQFHIYFETTGREGKRASERGRIVICLPLIRADEQLSREKERKAASTRAPPCQANKMSSKRWEKKEERRHRSTYLACHFLLGKKENC
jgi:hypothetical protein